MKPCRLLHLMLIAAAAGYMRADDGPPRDIESKIIAPSATIHWRSPAFVVHDQAAAKASPSTFCYLGQEGGDSLYIQFLCMDPDTDHLVTNRGTGGMLCADDSVEVYLDTNHDKQDYHQLLINSSGTVWSGYFDSAAAFDQCKVGTWQSGAKARTTVNKGGGYWTCEIRVPFANLGGAPKTGDHWGVNFCRNFRGQDKAWQLQTWFQVFSGHCSYHKPALFGDIQWPGLKSEDGSKPSASPTLAPSQAAPQNTPAPVPSTGAPPVI